MLDHFTLLLSTVVLHFTLLLPLRPMVLVGSLTVVVIYCHSKLIWSKLLIQSTKISRLYVWSVPMYMRVVVSLIVNPFGLLFHILSTEIVSLGIPSLSLFSSVSVIGLFISWCMTVFPRVYTTHRLRSLETRPPTSSQIVWRFFSPLTEMNRHLEDARRTNSVWMIRQDRWCVRVCISENVSHSCWICPTFEDGYQSLVKVDEIVAFWCGKKVSFIVELCMWFIRFSWEGIRK
jgi:hypothetical protein